MRLEHLPQARRRAQAEFWALYAARIPSYADRWKERDGKKVQAMLGKVPRGVRVLEIGCADGGVSLALLAHGCAVVSVDVCIEWVNRCLEKWEQLPLEQRKRWHLVCADVEWWEPPVKDFDVVLLADVLEHVLRPHRLMRRVRTWGKRVLVVAPIEARNDDAMDAERAGREEKAGDASGHVWFWDVEGLLKVVGPGAKIIGCVGNAIIVEVER